MDENLNSKRRWLIGASGAAVLAKSVAAQAADAPADAAPVAAGPAKKAAVAQAVNAVSPMTAQLADYIAQTLDRPLPDPVLAATKLHVLDTLAAMISGSRLKGGAIAARYIATQGGTPQAMVVGSKIVTTATNAAFANAMSTHSDETDDTIGAGPIHLGAATVPAALATAELAGRSGADFLRAVSVGYDVGTRIDVSLGINIKSTRLAASCMPVGFAAGATSAAMLRLSPRQVRYVLSYATQQASGTGIWGRDTQHIEKAFDIAGMGTRNGVMAATMVAFGFTGVEDPFSGDPNIFTTLANKPSPELLTKGLGTDFAVMQTTIKKWTVGEPLQAVMDAVSATLQDPGVRPDNVKQIIIQVPTYSIRIIDNDSTPDLSVRHLTAIMILDHGATFKSVHDAPRMKDAKVLAMRQLTQLVPSDDLQEAKPEHQAIVQVVLKDGRTVSHRTYVVRGTPGNPMDAQEIQAKALDLMGPVLGSARSQQVVDAIGRLDSFGPISGLRALLQT